jgi:hypothetical protein
MDLSRPFNPTVSKIDSSPKVKKTSLPLKISKRARGMSQSVPKKFKTPLSLSLLPTSSVSLKTPLFLSLSFSHPSLKLVSRQNRSPLAGAEEIGFSPRRKSPKPDGSFFSCSLTLSLTSPAHSIVTSLISPLSSHRYFGAHLRMPAPLCPYFR